MKNIIIIQTVTEKNVPRYFIVLLFLFHYYDHVIYVVTQ